jgi:hypothetical protein
MRQKPGTSKSSAERIVKDIRRRTRKYHSAEVSTPEEKPATCRRKNLPAKVYQLRSFGVGFDHDFSLRNSPPMP